MSNEKPKSAAGKTLPATPAKTPAPAPANPAVISPLRPAPLFRRIDWLTFLITFAGVLIGYYLTMAPELTLEDSGELATGSFYAGIPHPPGYPVWTIYTWFWTVVLPIKNVAWRVAFGEAVGGALAAGLLGMLVSRGSSLLMEGIEDLKSMTGKWENAICMVSGFVAGTLIGYNGFMWSQSVIVEVYAFSVASFMVVLLCLLRWIYAPQQRRYLYWALFFHGICFTNHQTLIVAAMGIEVAIAAANFRMGRYLFLGNSIIYLAGLVLKSKGMISTLDQNPSVFVIFNVVGVLSIAAYGWFTILSRESFTEFCLDCSLTATLLLAATAVAYGGFFLWVLTLGGLCAVIKFGWDTRKFGLEWLVVIGCGCCWIAGAGFYFYMPLAGMSNPPMEWGYPRTVEGFIHAFTRGQYEKTNPSDVIGHPGVFLTQLGMLWTGIIEEFNWVYVFLAFVPFLFFLKMHRRERAWLIGITAIYLCMGVLLLILLNPPPDRQAQGLVRVFFTSSHTLIALLVGYGLTLIAAYMATHFELFRRWGYWAGSAATALALYSLADGAEVFVAHGAEITGIKHLFATIAASILIGTLAAVIASNVLEQEYHEDAKTTNLIGLVVTAFSFISIEALLWFLGAHLGSTSGIGPFLATLGQAFSKDQYGVPVFAGILLIGMTVAFLAGLMIYKKRAPLALTLGLFALMPIHSIMTHWSDNEQRGHWFGYWFGHDMFTPPFKGADGKPLYPEMTKDTVLFGGTDPGRFCPTYMIFCDSFIPHKCQPEEDQKFDRRDVYIITQNALADGTYLNYIRAQYNRSTQIDPPFFQELFRSQQEREQNYGTNFLAKAVQPLDDLFIGLGDKIEKRRRTFTSWFTDKDFTDLSSFSGKLKAQQDPLAKYLYENLSPKTQQLLGVGNEQQTRNALAEDLNRLLERELEAKKQKAKLFAEKDDVDQAITAGNPSSSKRQRQQELEKQIAELSKIGPFYDPARFKNVQISEYLQDFIKENPQSHTRVRLNRLLLEAAYPKEIAATIGGVYPDREIYCPTPEDSQKCFQEYLQDAQRRLQQNQLKPGEDVKIIDNRVQVSGQVAVMAINGLLTKVIFDHNPKNEFFVEESFPLEWMYPYLTPFGIIMKINRQPLPELTEDIINRDHQFWKEYSKRLTGDIVDYDTPVKKIADFVEKVYLRRDYSGFTGDRKFIRDDQGQKAFSKLRSSIGGVYAWRISDPNNHNPVVQQRMIKEAEFAFKQAFAFCPYSPEAVFRYVNLLLSMQRFDEALTVASTCQKLDPFNGQVIDLVDRLTKFKKGQASAEAPDVNVAQLEKTVHDNPTDFQSAFNLAGTYLQVQQNKKAADVLDGVLNNPKADSRALRALIQAYVSISSTNGLQGVAAKLQGIIKSNPTDFDAYVALAETDRNLHLDKEELQVLDSVLTNPKADAGSIAAIAQEYALLHNYEKLEPSLDRLVKLAPNSPEAWYDLAAFKAGIGKTQEVIPALKQAIDLSQLRRKQDPKAKNLAQEAKSDQKFAALRQTAEFTALTASTN